MSVAYSKNSSKDFLNLKEIGINIAEACISTTVALSSSIPPARNIIDNRCVISYSNNSNLNKINSIHEMIYEMSAIEETIKKASPYPVENIKRSTVELTRNEFTMVDVYTKSNVKDDFKLFEAEGNVLNELPQNYYIRYF